jgi:hypothetical protein
MIWALTCSVFSEPPLLRTGRRIAVLLGGGSSLNRTTPNTPWLTESPSVDGVVHPPIGCPPISIYLRPIVPNCIGGLGKLQECI